MQALRVLVAVLGAAVVILTAANVLRSVVVPRARSSVMSRAVYGVVAGSFRLLTAPMSDYRDRDRVRAAEGPLILILLLAVWLAGFLTGFALLLWPWTRELGEAFRESGSSLFTLGFADTHKTGPTAVDLVTAAVGLVTVALQISYLPTIYSAFSRRETEVTMLEARAGSPPWGPELLARTRVGIQAESELSDFYRGWERWAAEVAESHSNYPVLVRFRSPQADASWVVGLVAVLDSAAMFHAIAPERSPLSGRLALRMGFLCLRQIAGAVGISFDPDPRPDTPISLTEEEFTAAVERLDAVGFPRERDTAAAWAHFRGWRVNYESIAYQLCSELDAVPALWTGPRRTGDAPIAPRRPPLRTPDTPDGMTPEQLRAVGKRLSQR